MSSDSDQAKTPQGIKDAVDMLFHGLNGPERWVEKALVEKLKEEHPTLQQAYWRVMKQVIFAYSEMDPRWVDARNNGSYEFCRRIANNEPNAMLVGLPVI